MKIRIDLIILIFQVMIVIGALIIMDIGNYQQATIAFSTMWIVNAFSIFGVFLYKGKTLTLNLVRG